LFKWKQFWIYVQVGKLCIKIMQKKTWCVDGRAPWRINHKNGHRKEVLLAWNEKRCRAFCAHLCKMSKHEIHMQKHGLYKPLQILYKPNESTLKWSTFRHMWSPY
jgi:hypothetical protein